MFFSKYIRPLIMVLLFVTFSFSSQADYPNKPIKLYIGFKAGGGTDTVGRVFAKILSDQVGQQVNVINKPGAGGCVAAMAVSRMKADGYNLLMDPSSSITWGRHTNPKCTIKVPDLTYVGMIAQFNFGLVAHKDAPYNTIEEFVKWGKGRTVSYVLLSPGAKALMKYIAKESGLKVKYVPAKGGADMINLILGKQVDLSFSGGIHSRHPDKIKLIASVASYRHAANPNVRTLKESGYNFEGGGFHTVAAPKGLPNSILSKLEAAMKFASTHPAMKDISNKTKFPIFYKTSKEALEVMNKQDENYGNLTKITGKM